MGDIYTSLLTVYIEILLYYHHRPYKVLPVHIGKKSSSSWVHQSSIAVTPGTVQELKLCPTPTSILVSLVDASSFLLHSIYRYTHPDSDPPTHRLSLSGPASVGLVGAGKAIHAWRAEIGARGCWKAEPSCVLGK